MILGVLALKAFVEVFWKVVKIFLEFNIKIEVALYQRIFFLADVAGVQK